MKCVVLNSIYVKKEQNTMKKTLNLNNTVTKKHSLYKPAEISLLGFFC